MKARRRNGLSDYHDVHIPVEPAEKIRKQIAVSAALREEHNLPYIFLHQHKGYKVKMLDVQYFTKFYQKAFDMHLSQNQLAGFSEEERQMLYVDFRLGNRRVELGFCTRKLCEGACKSRSRTVQCVNCPQLCTGVKYLPYWGKLLQAQRERIRALIIGYKDAEIEEYENFIEYRQEQKMLDAYENIVAELEKGKVVRL